MKEDANDAELRESAHALDNNGSFRLCERGNSKSGRANFVVIEDLDKQVGDSGKFLILQWNDLGSNRKNSSADQSSSWGEIKAVYK